MFLWRHLGWISISRNNHWTKQSPFRDSLSSWGLMDALPLSIPYHPDAVQLVLIVCHKENLCMRHGYHQQMLLRNSKFNFLL